VALMSRRMPFFPFTVGLAVIYVAERTLAGAWRTGLDVAGALLVLAGLTLATLRVARAGGGDGRKATGLALRCYLWALAGVGLYAVATLALPGAQHATARGVLTVAWPFVVLLGLGPALTVELALASMAQAPAYEPWRVRLAARAARIVVYAIIAFAGLNFAASRWNHKIDLSYARTTEVSESTLALVRSLTDPVRLVLFAPPGNEVMESARAYLEGVAAASPKVQLEIVDQALAPELARELKARQNGVLVVAREGRSETLQIGLELETARPILRKLDAEVQKRLLAMTRPPRVVYLTTGHLERDYEGGGSDKRPGLTDLKSLADSLGITFKHLGLGEGLGSAVPADAGVVAVIGPAAPFLPVERAALDAYAKRGGRLLVLIDPESGVTEDELLAPLGVRVTKALLASDRGTVRVPGRGDSPYFFATSRASSHPSVSTLGQNSGRMAVVVLGAGAVEKRPDAPADLRQVFTLHTLQESWLDLNGNAALDPPAETRASRELAVAIEKSAATAAAGAPPEQGLRAIVAGDADLVSDGVLGNPGNLYFAADALRWLLGDEAFAGKSTSEEDTPIVHKRDDDAVWFYGVSFVVPALVLAAGVFVGRRSRKGSRS
jgi:hypothetical protein